MPKEAIIYRAQPMGKKKEVSPANKLPNLEERLLSTEIKTKTQTLFFIGSQ